jgi:hypothetical protein
MHAGKVIVSWQFSRQHISGAELEPNSRLRDRVATGAVRIDLETGHKETLGPEQIASTLDTQLPDHIAQLMKSGELNGSLWRTSNVWATIERYSDKSGHGAILKRWHIDTGRPMPDVVILDAGLTFRYPSADGRYLLASKLHDPVKANWAWQIYSIETGEQVEEVINSSPAAWFFVTTSSLIHEARPTGRTSNGKLFIEQPLRLRAIELTTSEVLWEWPYRDTAYRGPYPAGSGGWFPP